MSTLGLRVVTVDGKVYSVRALDRTELDYAELNQRDGGLWTEADRYYRPIVLRAGVLSDVGGALSEAIQAQLYSEIMKLTRERLGALAP